MISKSHLSNFDSYPTETLYIFPSITRTKLLLRVRVSFRLELVDASPNCGSRSCINFSEFIWCNVNIFTFLNYIFLCVPFATPTILYRLHHRSTSDDCSTHNLCENCLGRCRTSASKFVSKYNFPKKHPSFVIWHRIR